jgi:hypothetical protein
MKNQTLTPKQVRHNRAFIQNRQHEFIGTLFTNTEDYFDDSNPDHPTYKQHTYGVTEPKLWNITTQTFDRLPDKFYVTNPDFSTASQEFYARLKIYLKRKLCHPFCKITIVRP